jgi:hypothetical protein
MITSSREGGQIPRPPPWRGEPAPAPFTTRTWMPMPPLLRSLRAHAVVAVACASAGAAPLAAQAPDLHAEAVVGSESERYLRLLQVMGRVPLYPWSIRGFSPAELDRLVPAEADHPWSARASAPSPAGTATLRGVRPAVDVVYNSAFPYGGNDGAVWAGRGVTASVSAGVEIRVGPLSARLQPGAFWSENRPFPLVPNRQDDSLRFRDARSPLNIDRPQRFGDGPYVRIHPGQTTVRVDVRGFSAAFSTANQQWGPAIEQPLVLGPDAAGFPHVLVGTSSPWKIGIGRLHGRVVWASLEQSEHSPIRAGTHGSRRYASGLAAVFLPYGLDGLEVGVTRFYHQPWPDPGLPLEFLGRPLESFLRARLPHADEAKVNQIASAFARWVLPRGGVEVYGEFAREDHSYDMLDLILEPDRSSGYMVGGRKVWGSGSRLNAFRAEWVNTQPGHLLRASRQSHNLYRHSDVAQGHTHRGQLLGSRAGYGGGGSVVALDGYTPVGRWTVDWTRTRVGWPRNVGAQRQEVGVIHSAGGEVVAFRGRMDLVARLRASVELERHPGEDVFNLNAGLGFRFGF